MVQTADNLGSAVEIFIVRQSMERRCKRFWRKLAQPQWNASRDRHVLERSATNGESDRISAIAFALCERKQQSGKREGEIGKPLVGGG